MIDTWWKRIVVPGNWGGLTLIDLMELG